MSANNILPIFMNLHFVRRMVTLDKKDIGHHRVMEAQIRKRGNRKIA